MEKSFRGNPRRYGKTIPHYPESVERQYQRLTDSYMKLLQDTLKDHLPKLLAVATEEEVSQYRKDGISDLIDKVSAIFSSIWNIVEQNMKLFGLWEKVEKMAKATHKLSIKEWKREVHTTLGIDILEDYYTGDFYKENLEQWVGKNVDLISTLPNQSLDRMKEIVLEGYKSGKPHKEVVKEMQGAYQLDKKHARFIARDQLAKLNSDITRHQQKDAGVEKYRWLDSGDSRVREGHRRLNGKIFHWDDPPVVDDKGRRCHPGEDYQCRCVAIPVFEIASIDLPIQAGKEGK